MQQADDDLCVGQPAESRHLELLPPERPPRTAQEIQAQRGRMKMSITQRIRDFMQTRKPEPTGRRRYRWTDERLAELRGYVVDDKMTDKQIAEKMGAGQAGIQSCRYSVLGIVKTKKIWDDEKLNELRSYVKQGLTDKQIAVEMKTTKGNIQCYRYKMLGIVKLHPNPDATLDFFAKLNEHPIRSSDTYGSNRPSQLYHVLRRKGFPVKCLRLSGRCVACDRKSKQLGRVDGSIYYVEGQQKQVFDMIKDKLSGNKISNISRILRMPSRLDLLQLRGLTGEPTTMRNNEKTRDELRAQLIHAAIDEHDKKAGEMKELEKKIETLRRGSE
jgi:hypothetical protein